MTEPATVVMLLMAYIVSLLFTLYIGLDLHRDIEKLKHELRQAIAKQRERV